MSLSPEVRGLLNMSVRSFQQRRDMSQIMTVLRGEPQIAEDSFQAIQSAALALNNFIQEPDEIVDGKRYLLKNSMLVRQIQKGKRFRTPEELVNATSMQDKKDCLLAFSQANARMSRGEVGIKEASWEFHQDTRDVGKILDIMAVGLYGLRLTLHAERFGANAQSLVAALCEMVAVSGTNTRMYRSINDWYLGDKIFSDEMAFLVTNDVDPFFEDGEILRKTPHFQARMQELVDGDEIKKVVVVEPIGAKANSLLLQATSVHNTDRKMVEVRGDDPLPSLQFHAIADFSPTTLRVILGGLQETPNPHKKSMPSLDKMEELIRSGQIVYPKGI